MSCCYLNESKDNIMDGIYCDKIGGRPGNSFWRCYCQSHSGGCPYNGGEDDYELLPETRERNRVIATIRSLPCTITEHDAQSVRDARYAYERLSYDQQKWVNNYRDLERAEEELKKALRNADRRDDVIRMIDRLPSQPSKQDRYAVEEARSAYDSLSYDQRQQVHNLHKLERAEKALGEKTEEQKPFDYDTHTDSEDTEDRFEVRTDPTPSSFSLLSFLCDKTDPHLKRTPVWVRLYRVILLLSMIFGLLKPASYVSDSIWVALIVFGGLQLLSFIIAFIDPDAEKLRGTVWLMCLVSLTVCALMIWSCYSQAMLAEILVHALWYPVLGISYIVLRAVLNFIL